jgi:transcription initiation factor TFIIE subunit alpha
MSSAPRGPTHTLAKPLGGVEGYRRLARLVARAFYAGECPPPEEEPAPDAADGGAPPPRRAARAPLSFAGLGILLIDHLASPRVDGYADEVAISADLRLGQKSVRRALRYLEAERLVAFESVRFAYRRRDAEAPDDPDVEERKRHETHVFWCLDYPRLVDAVRLRLARARETLRAAAEGDAVQRYACARCGAAFSALDAAAILDAATGAFRCEECGGELAEAAEGGRGAAAAAAARGPGAEAGHRERQAFFRDLLRRLDAQLAPLTAQLDRLVNVPPPDYGALQEWYAARREEEAKRAARVEELRRAAAAAGGTADLTDDQLLEWAERARVEVALPGAPGASGAGSAPAPRELPAWLRPDGGGGSAAAAAAASEEQAGAAAAAADADAGRRAVEQQYLRQYLAQVAAAAAAAAPAAGAPEAKRAKAEVEAKAGAGAGAPAAGGPAAPKAEAEEGGAGKAKAPAWEDAGGAAPAAAAAAGGDVEEDAWEDA